MPKKTKSRRGSMKVQVRDLALKSPKARAVKGGLKSSDPCEGGQIRRN
jgi:hypothetical protein